MKKKMKKVLLLGSGAIQIGQAGEFDYSGSQAIKSLKEENIKTVLVNPNIATIQTSDQFADTVYFLPINAYFVEKVIAKERPDGVLIGFGGQTSLNIGVELAEKGVFKKYNVEVLGTSIEAIINTEDRHLFVKKIQEINLKVPKSKAATTEEEAVQVAEQIGYPVMCRIAYALGGLGSGVAGNKKQLIEIAKKAFSFTQQILIEEYLGGWKEIEYEIVRDCYNKCVVVCSMENVDPMGIHTGESIVVAPVQTLTDDENNWLKDISIKVVRHLGIVGECNIQFAFNPQLKEYRIIEVNARLSRSSALASKATGYPLAFIATKLGLGYHLSELGKSAIKGIPAYAEPVLDYVVVKCPRWDLQKFRNAHLNINSEMKSVGEVMAIAKGFEEALQKAIRMLDIGMNGLTGNTLKFNDLERELEEPTDKRIFAIVEAIRRGYSIDIIYSLSKVNPWFLQKIKNIVDVEKDVKQYDLKHLPLSLLREAKQKGFSDAQIGLLIDSTEQDVRRKRKSLGVVPHVQQVDVLAANNTVKPNYLYFSYNSMTESIDFSEKKQVIVLGGGPYRIGSSVEFDWCCVTSVMTLKNLGYKTITVNCNPETVSTDYDTCDKLYFEEITSERVMDIYEKEKPLGVIVSMGGQMPNTLALPLHAGGVSILGTSPRSIDMAEDRHKFSQLLDTLGIDQPLWNELTSVQEAVKFADRVGYPILIRPSYVLSGAAMSVALSTDELKKYLKKASEVSMDHPVVISKFITGAKEIEIDAVARHGDMYCYAISEHVENAGVHSGDATIVLPPQRTYLETMKRVKGIAKKIAQSLEITGPFNIQCIAKGNDVKVIECNLRASRSFPFVSKVCKVNFADAATRVIMGEHIPMISWSSFDLDYVGVKAPQFSFSRVKGSDPVLGVEMVSTGEVACLGDDFNEAFLKSVMSVGITIPKNTILLSTGSIESKADFLESIKILEKMGFTFYATKGTSDFMKKNDIKAEVLHWPLENKEPNTLSYIADGKIDLVINIPKNIEKEELDNDYLIRRKAVDFNVPLITNLQLAKRFVEAIQKTSLGDLKIKSWDEYN